MLDYTPMLLEDNRKESVKAFGNLIQCTRLHDNTGTDAHRLPLTGDIDWKSVMSAFREIGYGGVLSHARASFVGLYRFKLQNSKAP